MIRGALTSLVLLAAAFPAAVEAEAPNIEVGKPFPLVKLPVAGKVGLLESLESYRGHKVMLHLFASW
jgi:hypothetical protein